MDYALSNTVALKRDHCGKRCPKQIGVIVVGNYAAAKVASRRNVLDMNGVGGRPLRPKVLRALVRYVAACNAIMQECTEEYASIRPL